MGWTKIQNKYKLGLINARNQQFLHRRNNCRSFSFTLIICTQSFGDLYRNNESALVKWLLNCSSTLCFDVIVFVILQYSEAEHKGQ